MLTYNAQGYKKDDFKQETARIEHSVAKQYPGKVWIGSERAVVRESFWSPKRNEWMTAIEM